MPAMHNSRHFVFYLAGELADMKKIALISDTHSWLDTDVIEHLHKVDEIWHGGDVGDPAVLDRLEAMKPVRAVYGNIDARDIRGRLPLNQHFDCEGVKVFMTHIGGYPGRYTKRVKAILAEEQPDLYICGHSHICKVLKDVKLDLIHMNPGACGIAGFHQFRTMLLFECEAGKINNLQLVEFGLKGDAPGLKKEPIKPDQYPE